MASRARIETRFSNTILQIRDRVIGLKVYWQIYNEDYELDKELQSKIVLAYNSFISFSIEAMKFYSMGGTSKCFVYEVEYRKLMVSE